MLVLGLNAYHGDSAAAIMRDGELLMAVEEERFTRLKHWAGFPKLAIQACLDHASATISDVDMVAVNREPNAQLLRKSMFVLKNLRSWEFISKRLQNRAKVLGLEKTFAQEFDIDAATISGRIHTVEHHLAHASSAYHLSNFQNAAILSVDAFGDWTSTMFGVGRDCQIHE